MEILNTSTELTIVTYAIGFVSVLGTIFFFACTINYLFERKLKIALKLFGFTLSCIVMFFIYGYMVDHKILVNTIHEVVVNDGETIDAEKYKVIEKRGKILKIQEIKLD